LELLLLSIGGEGIAVDRGSPFYFLALTPLSFSPSSLNSITNFRQPSLRRATCAPRARRSWRDR
jgi:hypothetical protein